MKFKFTNGLRWLLLITLLYSQGVYAIVSPAPAYGLNSAANSLQTESLTHLDATKALHNKILELEDFVVNAKKQTLSDQTLQVDRLTQYQKDIQLLGEQVQAEFQENRLKLEDLRNEGKISDEIITRHDETATKFSQRFGQFLQISSGLSNGNEPITEDKLEQLYDAAKQVAPPPEPRLTGVETSSLPEISVAERSNTSSTKPKLSAAQVNFSPPQPKDLAETVEIRFSPEIVNLAASLNNDPSRIYDYVHNEIQFEPYYGSIRGIEYLLLEKAANDYDMASLTIALLRASNIPARYVQGTVEIPADKAASIVGFVNTTASGSLYISAGMWESWEIGGFNLKMTWVIAHLGGQWVHIVPWYKDNIIFEGIDFAAIGDLDGEEFLAVATDGTVIDESENSYTGINNMGVRDMLSQAGGQINDYILDNFDPDTPLQEVLGGVKIQKRTNIPFTLPFTLVTTPQDFSEIGDSLRYKVGIEGGGIDLTLYTTEISGKRITLNYHAATEQDQAIIDSFGSIYDTPANLVNMEAALWIDGELEDVGIPFILGDSHPLTYYFFDPRNGVGFAQTLVNVGGYYAINFPVGRVSAELFGEHYSTLRGAEAELQSGQSIDRDDVLGQTLYLQTLTYWMEVHQYQDFSAMANNIRWVPLPGFVSTVGGEVWPFYGSDGTPVRIEPGRSYIDVRPGGNPYLAVADGGDTIVENWFESIGPMGSFMENVVFETSRRVPSYSAAKLLQLAHQQNKKVFTVSQNNLSSIVPQLGHDTFTIDSIVNSVNNGAEVIVSQQPVSYHGHELSGWIERYQNGSEAWMIQRNYDGGASIEDVASISRYIASISMDISKHLHRTVFVGTTHIIPKYKILKDKAFQLSDRLGKVVTSAGVIWDSYLTYGKVFVSGEMTLREGLSEFSKNLTSTAAGMVVGGLVTTAVVGTSVPAVVVAGVTAAAGFGVSKLIDWAWDTYLFPEYSDSLTSDLLFPTSQTNADWSDNFSTPASLRRMERTQWRAYQIELSHTSRHGIVMALGQRIDSMVITPDNELYGVVWPDVRIFRYDPGSQTITELGGAVNGMMDLWTLVYGPDGRIYGGTGSGVLSYLISFDPANLIVTNHGIPVSSGGDLPTAETDIFSLVSHTDGQLYGGTAPNGYLFSYNPSNGTFSVKGIPIAGETAIMALVSGPDGKVYGATSPNGHLFAYDPASDNFSDKGPVVSGESWVGSLTVGNDGLIYGGTHPNGHLFSYNPATNSIADRGSPIVGETTIVDLIYSSNGYLYGGTKPSGYLFVWDPNLESTVLAELLDNGEAYVASLAADSSGQVYAGTAGSAKLFSYNSTSYQPEGFVTSVAVAPPLGMQWNTLVYTTFVPANTSLTVDILNSQGDLLASDVSSGETLLQISPSHQHALKLKANLHTLDQSHTPVLFSWTMTVTPSTEIEQEGVYLPIVIK